MRWKWLLLLSLISISFMVVSADDDGVKVDTVNDDNDDDSYDDNTEDAVISETQTDSHDGDPSGDAAPAAQVAAVEEEPTDEDTVDVDNVPVGKKKGKYMNYDDYFVASQFDMSDTGYNWNGKFSRPDSLEVDWHLINYHRHCHKKLDDILGNSP